MDEQQMDAAIAGVVVGLIQARRALDPASFRYLVGSVMVEIDEGLEAALEQAYLTPRHRDAPGQGCLMAALGADAARQGPGVRRAVTEGFTKMLDLLTAAMPGRSKAARRQKALADYASLVGALVLARAVDDAALSDEILQAAAAALHVSAAAAAAPAGTGSPAA